MCVVVAEMVLIQLYIVLRFSRVRVIFLFTVQVVFVTYFMTFMKLQFIFGRNLIFNLVFFKTYFLHMCNAYVKRNFQKIKKLWDSTPVQPQKVNTFMFSYHWPSNQFVVNREQLRNFKNIICQKFIYNFIAHIFCIISLLYIQFIEKFSECWATLIHHFALSSVDINHKSLLFCFSIASRNFLHLSFVCYYLFIYYYFETKIIIIIIIKEINLLLFIWSFSF